MYYHTGHYLHVKVISLIPKSVQEPQKFRLKYCTLPIKIKYHKNHKILDYDIWLIYNLYTAGTLFLILQN